MSFGRGRPNDKSLKNLIGLATKNAQVANATAPQKEHVASAVVETWHDVLLLRDTETGIAVGKWGYGSATRIAPLPDQFPETPFFTWNLN